MAQIVFPYLPFPIKDPQTGEIKKELYRPIIPIKICYKHQFLPYAINCLVDSGSDRNLFPAYLGERVGIKIRKGIPQKIGGIGKSQVKGFTHDIKIFVDNLNLLTKIDFSYEHEIPILGRNGFFNLFKSVVFKEKEKVVVLKI